MTEQTPEKQDNVLLEVKNLKKYFPIRKGFFKSLAGYVKAVDGVNFFIREGDTMGRWRERAASKSSLSASSRSPFDSLDSVSSAISRLSRVLESSLRRFLKLSSSEPRRSASSINSLKPPRGLPVEVIKSASCCCTTSGKARPRLPPNTSPTSDSNAL